ncbi:hypothetical protein Pyrfu_1075 [Pyrolobus fumarii 1A]|uniref:Uncharacterized protein n=1 Tax=Pyrolobus fumarii (strain DSM 11204 / 1A) TaxID=694429 RepID=G0EF46_PYRF1|nr:helix-turn-helix domain-containing protein [Pyrolobus fumarii]AEM38943.1 hypothetical protein Pyrfu_1075 [Pyrolobus fumarii 1A]
MPDEGKNCYEMSKKERDELVVKLYKEGVPIDEIAKRACINKATIYLILRRHGIEPMRKRRRSKKLTPEEEEQLVREYMEGVPVQQLLEKYNISTTKLYEILKKHNVPHRSSRRSHSHRRVTPDEIEEIEKLYKQGATVYEIAKKLERPVSTVYAVLRRLGLK